MKCIRETKKTEENYSFFSKNIWCYKIQFNKHYERNSEIYVNHCYEYNIKFGYSFFGQKNMYEKTRDMKKE